MILPAENQTDVRPAEHPAKLDPDALGITEEQWDEGDGYVEYLCRQADEWRENPPAAPAGFHLIECTATPRHWPIYTVIDHDFYEAPCPMCQYKHVAEAHQGCEHSHHRAWRRWRVTHKLLNWGYSLGFFAGHGWKTGSGCRGCAVGVHFGKSPYLLGQRREWWACVLKRHHWPTKQLIALGMCSKCLPCVDCGSGEAWHECETPSEATG